MPTSASTPRTVNLGELQRQGISLYTREVASIVHEVCAQLGHAKRTFATLRPPTPDDLSVDRRGELLMRTRPAGIDEKTFSSLASLVEALLPAFSDHPDFAVPASLRVIPTRLRGEAGLPALTSLRQLERTMQQYETDDPTGVLQQLVVRVADAEGTRFAKPPADQATDPGAGVSFEADNPLDSFPSEAAMARPA